jgi:hypothetical protein
VSHCRFHGRLVLRVSVGALATRDADVRAVGDAIVAEAMR